MTVRTILRWALALVYLAAGIAHLAVPNFFVVVTPDWVPNPWLVVILTGMAELAGVVGLLQPFSPGLRKAAGWGLALYALCVWPANYNHMMLDLSGGGTGLGLGYHLPRMAFQPVFIWLALWTSGAVNWPRGWSKAD